MKYKVSTHTMIYIFLLGIMFLAAFTVRPVLAGEDGTLSADPVVVTASALKVDIPTLEIPRSVSVITEQTIETHAPQKLDEALRYTPGITSQPYGADNDTDWFKVRGFDAAMYLDGSRLFRDGYYTWLIEPYGLEGIEIVKGPASILFGESPPGGVVNVVQKKPLDTPRGEIRLQGGTSSHLGAAFDVSDTANKDGSVRFRMVGMARDEDGELNGTENRRYYFAPSLAIDISDKTNLTLMATLLEDDGIPTNPFFPAAGTLIGTPYGTIDPSTNLGEPDYDAYERTQVSLGYALEHQINDVWEYSQNFTYGYNELFLRSSYAFPNSDPSATTLFRGIVYRNGENNSFTFDNKAVAEWESGRTAHTALMGIDLQHHKTEGVEQDNYAFGTINPYSPVYGNFTPLDPANDIDREITKIQASAYSQYQLKFDGKWVGVIGGRYDWVETENFSEKNSQDESRDDGEFSINTGLMYIADNGLSPYVSYAQSFDVLSTIDPTTGDLYKPLEGEQVEIGVKYLPHFIDGYINVALFDITQENALVTNPSTFVATQTGEVTSRGIEIEGMVDLTDHLVLRAGYTYIDAETDDTGGQGKKQAGLIPRHTASAWLEFDAAAIGLTGLTVGNGVRYVGESKDSPASSDLTVPDVTLWDAMVSYDIGQHWELQLNVNNILDKEYISACDYYCYYGQSRSAVLSVGYNW
ncbi:MAG: TonB-dependent siderophore receptor [Desulfobacter sp.]